VISRAVIAATAVTGIGITLGACAGSPAGTWAIASCRVDVTYIDDANTADYYVPDTAANFQKYLAPNQASGVAGIAVVVTFVNKTGHPASLPTGLVVSFTDQTGNLVGNPQRINGPYGSAVTNGHGSGEAFSTSTLFNPGETIAESPDLGASVPRQPDLSCSVSHR
jgi:hypothetical protein